MKTERRHDLETNYLARKLAAGIECIKPYSSVTTVVVVGLIAVVGGWFFLRSQATGREAAAWNEYFLATVNASTDPAKLRETAQHHNGSSVAYWANLALADSQLLAGTEALFSDKTLAKKSLNDALATYRKVVESSGAADPIRERARFGMARSFEAMGDIDKAREHYLTVRGTFASLSKARAEALDRPSSRRFYDWFANAQPPAPPMTGLPGIPGQRPLFDVPSGDDILDSGLLPDSGLGLGDDDSAGDDVAPDADGESPDVEPSSEPQTGEPQ